MNTSSKITFACGLLIVWLTCFFEGSALGQNRIELLILNCKDNSPVKDVMIYNSGEEFITSTNENGKARIQNFRRPGEFNLKKLGSIDTLVSIFPGQDSVCLRLTTSKLPSVEIVDKPVPLNKQFEAFIEKNEKLLPLHDDSLVYGFTYRLSVPDSNWQMRINGKFMIPVNSYKKRTPGMYNGLFYQVNVQADSAFWNSKWPSSFSGASFIPLKYGDEYLRKPLAYRKKIKKENVLSKTVKDKGAQFIFKNVVYSFWTRMRKLIATSFFNEDSVLVRDKHVYIEDPDRVARKTNINITLYAENEIEYELRKNLIYKGFSTSEKNRHSAGFTYRNDLQFTLLGHASEFENHYKKGIPVGFTFCKERLKDFPGVKVNYITE